LAAAERDGWWCEYRITAPPSAGKIDSKRCDARNFAVECYAPVAEMLMV
jgi:hypothetical protein